MGLKTSCRDSQRHSIELSFSEVYLNICLQVLLIEVALGQRQLYLQLVGVLLIGEGQKQV